MLDHAAPSNLGEPTRKLRGIPARTAEPAVVGTYRLLRQEVAERHFGFYTQSEYDIAPILAAHPTKRFLELGRSCVLGPYRTKRTVELLWHGIWAYVLHHRIDVMLGCASLEGTDPDKLALPLSFLHHHASAPTDWRARALDERYVPMGRLDKAAIDPKSALHALPPLIKGYLRIGATFGDGRGGRQAVRHDRRAGHAAGLGDQPTLHRPFRGGRFRAGSCRRVRAAGLILPPGGPSLPSQITFGNRATLTRARRAGARSRRACWRSRSCGPSA